MRPRRGFELPPAQRMAERRARRLEWVTIGFLLSIAGVVYYTMGSSQAMKTAWVEDLLSLIPPIAFLVATRVADRAPDHDFPYGHQRAMSLSFLVAAFALLILGLYLVYEAASGLLAGERPSLGHREILGVRAWSGWWMLAALVYSALPPVILGHMKLPLARALHDKTLHTDAAMNRADWMTATAAMAGILGVGAGLWWADGAAALFISVEVVRDGFGSVAAVFGDLADRRPTAVDRKERDGTPERAAAALRELGWVADAAVRLREEGRVLTGEAFVVAVDGEASPAELEEAGRVVHDLDWRLYDVVIVPVRELPDGVDAA